jgi:hypothetical protein
VKACELFGQAADADLILASSALLLLAIGTAGWCIAGHPAKVQALIDRVRQHPRATRTRSLLEALVRRFHPKLALRLSLSQTRIHCRNGSGRDNFEA